MRRYETIVILSPDLPEETRQNLCDQVVEQIDQQQGFLAETDVWGNRRLAYDIRKKSRGFYVRFDFCGEAALVDELERRFQINDAYLKYMTVVLDKDVDLIAVKEEAAQAHAEAEKIAAEKAAAAEAAAERAAEAQEAEAKAAEDEAQTADATASEKSLETDTESEV